MIDSLHGIPDDDDLFNEFLILNGFKLVATENMDDVPPDKNVLILHSKSKGLFRKLKRWAYGTNSIIIFNATNNNFDNLQNIVAVVIDKELLEINPMPDNLWNPVIPAELEIELIENILNGLSARKK